MRLILACGRALDPRLAAKSPLAGCEAVLEPESIRVASGSMVLSLRLSGRGECGAAVRLLALPKDERLAEQVLGLDAVFENE